MNINDEEYPYFADKIEMNEDNKSLTNINDENLYNNNNINNEHNEDAAPQPNIVKSNNFY